MIPHNAKFLSKVLYLSFPDYSDFLCVYLQHKAIAHCSHVCFDSICLTKVPLPNTISPNLALKFLPCAVTH